VVIHNDFPRLKQRSACVCDGACPLSPEGAASPLRAPIEHATLVRAPVDKVFRALSTADGLNSWWTQGTTMERRVGGRILFAWRDWGPDRVTVDGAARILQLVENEVFAWRWDDAEGYPSRTSELEVEPRDHGTIVRVTDTPTDPDAPHGEVIPLAVAAGWGEALTLLKMYVEHGARY